MRTFILVLFGFVLLAPAAYGDVTPSVELLYTGSVLTNDGALEHNRRAIYGDFSGPMFASDSGELSISFKASILGALDHVEPTREGIVRELYVDMLAGDFSLRAGFQDIPWSETFGFFIADLVNPRDLRDPLYLDPRFARLPVFALKPQWTIGNVSLQGVLAPVARNTLYSSSLFNGMPVQTRSHIRIEDFPRDLEAGFRAETLLFDKLDCALFYLNHRNRALALEQVATSNGSVLETDLSKVNSIGLTSSLALESIVFREDFVYTPRQPATATDYGAVRHIDAVQSILGMDYSTPDGFVFGVQYQIETHPKPFHWLSFRISRDFSEHEFGVELFTFNGIGNRDLWVQPKLNWRITDDLTLSIRYDWVAGAEQKNGDFAGYLTTLADSDRALAEIGYKF